METSTEKEIMQFIHSALDS